MAAAKAASMKMPPCAVVARATFNVSNDTVFGRIPRKPAAMQARASRSDSVLQ